MLQPTAPRCNPLHHIAPRCTTLHHTATRCNALQHTCAVLKRVMSSDLSICINDTLQHTAPHCTTLHHTAPHCTTLHHAATHLCRTQEGDEQRFVDLHQRHTVRAQDLNHV